MDPNGAGTLPIRDGHRVNNVTKEWLRLINYQIYQRICCPKVINPGKSPWCGWYDGYDGYVLCLNWRFPTRRDFRRRCYWFLMMGCGDPHCHVSLPEATIKLPILGWNPIVLLGNSSFRLMSAGSDPSIPLLKTTLLMATFQFLPLNSTVLRLHPPFLMTLTWSHHF